MNLEFHHIGIATEDIELTIEKMRNWFVINSRSEIIFDELQNASLCMLHIANGLNIELISGEKVTAFIKKRIYLYHICYCVDNITEAVTTMEQFGGMVISEPKEAILFNNKKVAFIMNEMGMIELLEK